jgi:hypothetical protein
MHWIILYLFLHIRLVFPWVLLMLEISCGMGVPDESRAKQQRHFSVLYEWTALKWHDFRREMMSFGCCYLSCKFIRYCKKTVMDEMTLISMNIYRIKVNHFEYEIIWQNMQEKISDMFVVRTRISVPREPANGRVPSGRIFQSKPQHMTDNIIPSVHNTYPFNNTFKN